jgi:hypothetical protein
MVGAATSFGVRYSYRTVNCNLLWNHSYRTSCRSHSAPAWNAALAAHLALAVVRPGEPGLVQVTLRASRLAKTRARAPRFSARSRRRRGEEGGRAGGGAIAVKLPSQRFKSNEMPVAPDRVCPIRSFTPLGASPNRAATPGRCRRSKRARPAPPRPPDTFRAGPHASKGVTQENPSRCRRGFVVFDQHCTLRK